MAALGYPTTPQLGNAPAAPDDHDDDVYAACDNSCHFDKGYHPPRLDGDVSTAVCFDPRRSSRASSSTQCERCVEDALERGRARAEHVQRDAATQAAHACHLRNLHRPFEYSGFGTPRHPPLDVAPLRHRPRFMRPPAVEWVEDLPLKFPGTGYRVPSEFAQLAEPIALAAAFFHAIGGGDAATDDYYCYLTFSGTRLQPRACQVRKGYSAQLTEKTPRSTDRNAPHDRFPQRTVGERIHCDGFLGAHHMGQGLPLDYIFSVTNTCPTTYFTQSFDCSGLDPAKQGGRPCTITLASPLLPVSVQRVWGLMVPARLSVWLHGVLLSFQTSAATGTPMPRAPARSRSATSASACSTATPFTRPAGTCTGTCRCGVTSCA
eukprot:COSAG01_NODE_14119_length_1494_cov_0.932616_2_plen_377_part_00